MLLQVGGDLAGVVDAVVIADHHDHRSPRERLGALVQQGDEVRRAAAAQPVHPGPVLTSSAPSTVTFRFVPGVRNLRAGAAQRPAGPHVRQQVQVRLVLGEHDRPARQLQQPGHDPGHHVVMVRVAAGGQLRPPPDRHQPDPPVQRPHADLRPAQVPPDPGQGPRARAGQQRGDPPGQPLSAQPGPPGPRPVRQPGQPLAVEPADPAAHRGRVAVQQLRDLDAGKPCADSSTITARAACRHRPCRSARSCSISLPGPLANTLTGRILITTSPAGWTM